MGRRRKHRLDLPQRFYSDRGVYYWWPYGKTKVWFRHADGRPMSLGEALKKYADLIDIAPQVATVGQLMDEYFKLELPKLKPRTQVDRRIEFGNLRAVFGAMGVLEVEPRDVVGYKMLRRTAPIRCNRELSALSALFSFAINFCGVPLKANPCREVDHFPKNAARDRYPEPNELEAFKALCIDKFKDRQTALYVDLKRAIGMRVADMVTLHRSMIREDGLRVDSGKRGKKHYFPFTDTATGESTALRELLDEILALPRPVGSLWLFSTRRGQSYTVEGFQSNWQRRMAAFVEAGGVRFWEHDIRATAGAEVEEDRGIEDARKLLGHDEQSTTRIYTGRRKVITVMPNRRKG